MLNAAPSKPAEPEYTSEVDVLGVVANLEQKYGKKILTEEQREKINKGQAGVGEDGVVDSRNEMVKMVGLLVDGAAADLADTLMGGRKGWESVNKGLKRGLGADLFRLIHGSSVAEMKRYLMRNSL